MPEKGVKRFMGRLLTDEDFQEKFFADPQGTIAASGYDIRDHEAAAIAK